MTRAFLRGLSVMAAANIIKLLAVAIILHKIVFIRLRALLSI